MGVRLGFGRSWGGVNKLTKGDRGKHGRSGGILRNPMGTQGIQTGIGFLKEMEDS